MPTLATDGFAVRNKAPESLELYMGWVSVLIFIFSGFENGGKMIARLVITAKNKASTKDIQAK